MSKAYDLYALNGTYLRTIDYDQPPPVLFHAWRCYVQHAVRRAEYYEVEYAVLPEGEP